MRRSGWGVQLAAPGYFVSLVQIPREKLCLPLEVVLLQEQE